MYACVVTNYYLESADVSLLPKEDILLSFLVIFMNNVSTITLEGKLVNIHSS